MRITLSLAQVGVVKLMDLKNDSFHSIKLDLSNPSSISNAQKENFKEF